MPLLSFWKNAREEVLKLNIEQVVSNAGDGNLRDSCQSSQEFREFLSVAPVEKLFDYARYCLESAFNKSGLVLQDVVNELGRRLEFEVENGLYQGKRTAVGFDGIWRAPGEPPLIVEVKTTDYVTVSLDKLAQYKERLTAEERVTRNAAVLIIVGREDTGALEAQVRGSRYAWEMRLISIEGLVKLVQIKQKSDDSSTLHQIRQLLQPFEYTKIDKIIDVIFTATINVESQQEIEQATPTVDDLGDREVLKQIRTDPELLSVKRQQAVDAFSTLKGKELVRKSKTLFWTSDRDLRVCCAVSKRYEGEYQPYWYAYHPKWDEFLAESKEAYFILACMDRDEAYALPHSWLKENKQNLNMTERGERSYWHIALTTVSSSSKLAINVSRLGTKTALEPFRFAMASAALSSRPLRE